MGTRDQYMVGKVIAEMKIADDKKALLFVTTDGEHHVAKTDGDCCSETWIESIELPAKGFPATVLAVSDLDMPEGDWDEADHEHVSFYGCKITTDKGVMIIDYRNSSNGYYGGDLCWPGEYFYGGVFDQNVSTEQWVGISDNV